MKLIYFKIHNFIKDVSSAKVIQNEKKHVQTVQYNSTKTTNPNGLKLII